MMKYLVFAHPVSGAEKLHAFNKTEGYVEAVKILGADLFKGWKVVRGGSVMFVKNQPECFGEAFELGLRSDPDKDMALLLKCLEV